MSLFPSRASSTLETSSALPNLPLIYLTPIPEERKRVLSTLPSAHFGHARWTELRNAELKASQLHCPRVRFFHKDLPDEKISRSSRSSSIDKKATSSENNLSGIDKATASNPPSASTCPPYSASTPSASSPSASSPPSPFVEDCAQRATQSRALSDWSASERVNLSYQGLHDPFQRDNFQRILQTLDNVVVLVLVNNSIHRELRKLAFDKCKVLHLGKNLLESFTDLPKVPRVEEINLDDNHVMGFDGIKHLRLCPHLTSLSIRLNPIVFESEFRVKSFEEIPSLQRLDGVAKQPEDVRTDYVKRGSKSDEHVRMTSSTWSICIIS